MTAQNLSNPSAATSEPAGPADSSDHQRGLHDVEASIVSLCRPSPGSMRVCMVLGSSLEDPAWMLPNVAFRIQLQEKGAIVSRIYTARRFWPEQGKLEFDLILHGANSPMMRWAAQARICDVVHLIGPRANIGIPPAQGRSVAMFLDGSALPALYSVLQQWLVGVPGVGWIASDDPHAMLELPRVPGLALHQVAEHGRTPQPLLHHARCLQEPGAYVVWGAGERDEMRAIRQHFQTVGLVKTDIAIAGYWKQGASNTEIDAHRLEGYRRFMAVGGQLADWDDLALPI